MSASELSIDQQRERIYVGICAVASRCDGAVTQDGVGFRGQDTLFGRRIASVPFADWTEAVHEEAATLANVYQGQILAYTGTDVSTLPVVQAAIGRSTNHQARNDARTFERRAQAAASRTVTRRMIEGRDAVAFSFPYDEEIKGVVKEAGCRFNPAAGNVWWAPVECYNADLRAAAAKWFTVAPEVAALAATPAAPPEPVAHIKVYEGKVAFKFDFDPIVKNALKAAGCRWDGANKVWRVKADAGAVAAIEIGLAYGLVASEGALKFLAAVKTTVVKGAVATDRASLLKAASVATDPASLDPAFEALVTAALR